MFKYLVNLFFISIRLQNVVKRRIEMDRDIQKLEDKEDALYIKRDDLLDELIEKFKLFEGLDLKFINYQKHVHLLRFEGNINNNKLSKVSKILNIYNPYNSNHVNYEYKNITIVFNENPQKIFFLVGKYSLDKFNDFIKENKINLDKSYLNEKELTMKDDYNG